jgi:hypothetical protein
MPNQTRTEKPPSTEEFHTAKTGQDKKIDRTAEQAGKTEKHYDQDHDIFTK